MAKTVWNVAFLDENGEHIDSTQIDEKSSELAWQLFAEFGHTKKEGYTLEWDEVIDEDDDEPTLCCPTCGGENIRSFDNEPLYHPSKLEVEEGTPRYDNEVIIKFICDDCPAETRIFTKVFTLNLK